MSVTGRIFPESSTRGETYGDDTAGRYINTFIYRTKRQYSPYSQDRSEARFRSASHNLLRRMIKDITDAGDDFFWDIELEPTNRGDS